MTDSPEPEFPERGDQVQQKIGELIMEEARTSLDRQNQTIREHKDSIMSFMRYHLIFLGLFFTIAQISDQSFGQTEMIGIAMFVITQFVGIASLALAYNRLTGLTTRINPGEMIETIEPLRTYSTASKTMTMWYGQMYERNQKEVEKHYKYWMISWGMLSVGFGLLLPFVISSL